MHVDRISFQAWCGWKQIENDVILLSASTIAHGAICVIEK